jgi:phage tail protein X
MTMKLIAGRLYAVKEQIEELEARGVFIPAALSVAVEDIEEGLKRLLAFVQAILDANPNLFSENPELFTIWDEARGWLAVHELHETK